MKVLGALPPYTHYKRQTDLVASRTLAKKEYIGRSNKKKMGVHMRVLCSPYWYTVKEKSRYLGAIV